MKTKRALLVAVALLFLSGCVTTEGITALRDYSTPLRGVIRAGWSLDPDWNVDVWMGVKSRSGRPPSFVLLPQGSMEWEAVDYQGFYLYAEAWRFNQDNQKVVLARTKRPTRIVVSTMADRDGYGWSVEIEAEDNGTLYIHQRSPLSRWGWY